MKRVESAAPVTISQTDGVTVSITDRIKVASAANITLADVIIDFSSSDSTSAFRITIVAGR